jgi:hypothetical protein
MLVDFNSILSENNKTDPPTPNTLLEGQLVVDRLDDVNFSFVYVVRFIDPFSIDYTEKHTPEEDALVMPSTPRYIQWYKDGILPMPISVVFQQVHNKFMSTNRRRLIAARAAGVKNIPALV